MMVMPYFHRNGRNKLTVGKMEPGLQKEKPLDVVSLHAGQFALLFRDSNQHFPLNSSLSPC
jgi:hypothetical protein